MISKDMGDIADSEEWNEIQEEIGDYYQLFLVFDEGIGKELKIDPNKPASYKDYDVAPTIRSPFQVRNRMQMKTALLKLSLH
ncbi:hypothetical protein ACQKKK_15725 [Peribacillus sp. NPDC006672]|uniref:hypothetical protein n=1 Tax=Peribacillus sp. NPDC006672 TaxID=3390606 RepID=UPI003D040E12